MLMANYTAFWTKRQEEEKEKEEKEKQEKQEEYGVNGAWSSAGMV